MTVVVAEIAEDVVAGGCGRLCGSWPWTSNNRRRQQGRCEALRDRLNTRKQKGGGGRGGGERVEVNKERALRAKRDNSAKESGEPRPSNADRRMNVKGQNIRTK